MKIELTGDELKTFLTNQELVNSKVELLRAKDQINAVQNTLYAKEREMNDKLYKKDQENNEKIFKNNVESNTKINELQAKLREQQEKAEALQLKVDALPVNDKVPADLFTKALLPILKDIASYKHSAASKKVQQLTGLSIGDATALVSGTYTPPAPVVNAEKNPTPNKKK